MFTIQEAGAELLSGNVAVSSVYGGFAFDTSIQLSDLETFNPFNVSYPPNFEALVEEVLVNVTQFKPFPPTPPCVANDGSERFRSNYLETCRSYNHDVLAGI